MIKMKYIILLIAMTVSSANADVTAPGGDLACDKKSEMLPFFQKGGHEVTVEFSTINGDIITILADKDGYVSIVQEYPKHDPKHMELAKIHGDKEPIWCWINSGRNLRIER